MAEPTQSRSGIARIGVYLFLCAITLGAYWPVFTLDFIRYDDTLYVTDNDVVKQGLSWPGVQYAATAIVSGNYHPLTVLSHELDVTLFGLNPTGHHAVNLLFHIVNACLLYRLLSTSTGALRRSLLVAALFAVHPLHVESVAWVSERKDMLSTLFMFLAIGSYFAFVRNRRRSQYVRLLVYFAFALLAKPMPVTLPFLLLLFDYWPLHRTSSTGPLTYARELPALAVEKWPLFALSTTSCIVTYAVQYAAGATRSLGDVPLMQRVGTAAVAYTTYLWKMVVPINLAPNYPLSDVGLFLFTVSVILFAAITVLAVALFRWLPAFFVGWFWYAGMLVPVIGLVSIGNQAYADRYTYVPMVGFAVAVLWPLTDVIGANQRARRFGLLVAATILIGLSALTMRQTQYWRNTETLFSHTLTVSPRSAIAHKLLGIDAAKNGAFASALEHFERSNELNPRDRTIAFNLGTTLLQLNKPEEAIPWLNAALEAYDKPADVHASLGLALLRIDRLLSAREHFAIAIELDPDQTNARINLGIAEGMLGNPKGATDALAEAVRREPGNADAHYNYGIALINAGRPDEAAEQFEEALRLKPDSAEAAAYLQQVRGAATKNPS